MTTAKRLHAHSRATRRPQTILTIVSDDHNVHCLEEGQLDTWWASLEPHQKADLYERELEAVEPEADPVANSFVRLRAAEGILAEARRVANTVAALNSMALDAHGKPAREAN